MNDDLETAQAAYDKAHQELMAAASQLEEAKRQDAEKMPPQDYDVDV